MKIMRLIYSELKNGSLLKITLVLVLLVINAAESLYNGLALTPPMGWLAWERFKCNINCKHDPENCISQQLFMDMADRLVEDGFKDVGYTHINIDDCWMLHTRDANGNLVADPERFSNGIEYLADYMHNKGLKIGIYQDFGKKTCMGYPGIIGHMEQDAEMFAKWKIDYLKLDGCHSHPKDMDKGYTQMGNILKATGRPMVYSCSWPYYQMKSRMEPNYTKIAHYCNLWRAYDDIEDSWGSIISIIDYFGDNQEVLAPHAGPGHWNDPDMLIIGNFGLSYDQAKVQMGMWAIFAAPLLMSNDLRNLKTELKEILINKDVIAINQDPLGIQGKRVYKKRKVECWLKPISPQQEQYFSYGIAFLNRRTNGSPIQIKLRLSDLNLNFLNGYHLFDTFSKEDYGILKPNYNSTIYVNPTGIVLLRANLVIGSVPDT